MKTNETLELLANSMLEDPAIKPNYSNRDFMNCVIIFQTALMDKMWDLQQSENMEIKDRENMAIKCGEDLRKLIITYTNLDTFEVEKFL